MKGISACVYVAQGSNPSLLTLLLGIKTKTSHIFLVEFVKKVLETHVILINCCEIVFKKIDYVECLLHAFLNYLIFGGDFFQKSLFKKIPHFFAGFRAGFTGILPVGPVRFTKV